MANRAQNAMPTVVAMLMALVIAWVALGLFVVRQDTWRKEQIKGMRKDLKAVNTQLESAAVMREDAINDINVIREDVNEIHSYLRVPDK